MADGTASTSPWPPTARTARWQVEELPTRARRRASTAFDRAAAVAGDGGSLGLVSVAEDCFVAVRVLGRRGAAAALRRHGRRRLAAGPRRSLERLGRRRCRDGRGARRGRAAGDLRICADLGVPADGVAMLVRVTWTSTRTRCSASIADAGSASARQYDALVERRPDDSTRDATAGVDLPRPRTRRDAARPREAALARSAPRRRTGRCASVRRSPDGRSLGRGAQPPRGDRRPHRTRRGAWRCARPRLALGRVAAGRLHAGGHARAVHDVRRRARAGPGRPAGLRCLGPQGGRGRLGVGRGARPAAQPPPEVVGGVLEAECARCCGLLREPARSG